MKILLVSPLPPPAGGIATWTVKYLEYCRKNDIEVSVVNIALTGNRGVQVNTKKNFFDEIKRTKKILSALTDSIDKFSPDVIHINTSCSKFGIVRDYLCTIAAKKKKLPVVLQCHCDVKNHVRNKVSFLFFRKMVRLSDIVLTLNSRSCEYVNNILPNCSVIVPNFIDTSMLNSRHDVHDELKNAVFVGHVQRSKGCIEIVEAAKMLPSCHFTLVGPVSKELSEIEYPENVSFVGVKSPDEVKEYLSNADVFVLPSYSEGFSLALTEAMAMGLPVVATDVGANSDMIEDSGGVIVPVKDSSSIVEAFKRIAGSDVRKIMSKWNFEKVKYTYLTDVVMKQIVDLYKRII